MTSTDDGRKSGKTGKSGGREQRLAAALRENLRRRKAQVRGRSENPDKNRRPTSEPEQKTRD